jgi:hypothetical protein
MNIRQTLLVEHLPIMKCCERWVEARLEKDTVLELWFSWSSYVRMENAILDIQRAIALRVWHELSL